MNKLDAAKFLPILKAYSEGKTIQVFLSHRKEWVDNINGELSFRLKVDNYRIKPKRVKYKRYLIVLGDVYYVLNHNEYNVTLPEDEPCFIKWIDNDWQEIEIPSAGLSQ